MNDKKVNELPATDDVEFWGEGERYSTKPVGIDICPTHGSKNWKEHDGYVQHADGTIVCLYCPWGTRIPGYYRVVDGKVVDLRRVAGC